MEPAIALTRLRKTFGTTVAVEGMDLVVPRGALYGVIGPNGAGKTTTIRMIMSILFQDSGDLSVLGHRSALEAKDRIGVRGLAGQHDDRGGDAVLPHQPAGVAAVHVGQLDIENDEVCARFLGLADAFAGRASVLDPESLVQLELLGQGLAQFGVVVHEQDRLGGGHSVLPAPHLPCGAREV